MSLFSDRSIIRRALTIFVVAPTVVALVLSDGRLMAALVWALSFVAMLEWTAMKRHLKVTLLWSLGCRSSTANTTLAAPSTPSTIECGAVPEVEYAVPSAKTNLFIVCKSLASSLVALGAAFGPELFQYGTHLYFLFWVLFTLMGRNRAETTAIAARKQISAAVTVDTRTTNAKRTSSPAGRKRSISATNAAGGDQPLTKTQRELDEAFQRLELAVIADHFTTDIFLSFSLEYFGFVWISGLSYATLLYQVPRYGVLLVATVLISNWSNDIAALVVGKSLKGRTHALYPRLSPNKSLEGAIAGVLVNAVVMSWMLTRFGSHLPCFSDDAAADGGGLVSIGARLSIGLVFGVLGVMGDLLQSLFKRTAGIKDTGSVFPGHGGVLDRIDGLLIVYPVAYWGWWAATAANLVS